jgi:putative endonuclease
MAEHNNLGKWGEDSAVNYLKRAGYEIIDTEWRNGRSKVDLDIVCRTPDETTVVFVEVKTRSYSENAFPEDAIDLRKVRHLGRTADAYIRQHNVSEELRFDIITVIGQSQAGQPEIQHVKDAFNPLLL